MKADAFKEILLSKDQLKLHQVVIDYLIQVRKTEQTAIKNQAPNFIPKNYNLAVCLFFTLLITVLNFDQLFKKVEEPTEPVVLKNYEQVQKKVEYVFEHTIMKYSILYPMKLTQCQSYIPFIKSATLCSEKSIDVKAKLVYQIGFKPNYEKLSYSPQNNSISGEWGPLQILSMTEGHDVQAQNNGFINDWSVLQFQTKYRNKIKALTPRFEQKVNQYIENITQNQQSLQKLENNIKNSLIRILNDGKEQRVPLSDLILNTINKGFDKLLIFLSMDPLMPPQKKVQKDEFSPEFATQFYKEQIFSEEEVIEQPSVTQPIQTKAQNSSPKKQQTIQDTQQNQTYNSDEIRQKYNALLKKVK